MKVTPTNKHGERGLVYMSPIDLSAVMDVNIYYYSPALLVNHLKTCKHQPGEIYIIIIRT